MNIFKLEKPDISKIEDERMGKLLSEHKEKLFQFFQKTLAPKYLYWDKAKFKDVPKGVKPEEMWLFTKVIRSAQAEKAVIKNEKGENFSWIKLPNLESFHHKIDMQLGGRLLSLGKDIDDKMKASFVSQGILEEAIASSQLEGANTTRKVAKTMIREGRKPRTSSEQMIMNNYEAMQGIEGEYRKVKLDRGILLELHRLVTHDTDVPKTEQGRFRKDEDDIVVKDVVEDIIYHIPPKEKVLSKEIERLIAYANDDKDQFPGFVHPVIKAIMLHFWIGYLHPFTDGNGRMARLIFYWYLLKHDYWAFSYLPISKVIKRAKKLYTMAYVYSEQDESDLTYFIDYHIDRINLAIQDFEIYLEEKVLGNKKMNRLVKTNYNFNDRQIQTLQYLFNDPDEYTTMRAHQSINQISRKTAYSDLKELEKLDFLRAEKQGRRVLFFGTKKIQELFK